MSRWGVKEETESHLPVVANLEHLLTDLHLPASVVIDSLPINSWIAAIF